MVTESQPCLRRFMALVAGVALLLASVLPERALAAGRTTHVVRAGESLWSIARQELGDPARWSALYRANRARIGPDPALIHPGLSLTLDTAARLARAGGRYRVRPGDSLWGIAAGRLGGGERWRALYARNRAAIGDNPRLIHPGSLLVLGPAAPLREAARPAQRRIAKIPAKAPGPVAKAPPAGPVAKAPPARPVAKAPPARPVAKAPPARPVAKAPPARPVAKAPPARPVAKAPPRNPFEYRGGAAKGAPPEAARTPPGRNPFAFGGEGAGPAARSLPGQAQRRVGGMPVVPGYPEERPATARKGTPPVAVDVRGGRPVARGKRGRRHLASSPGPSPKKD